MGDGKSADFQNAFRSVQQDPVSIEKVAPEQNVRLLRAARDFDHHRFPVVEPQSSQERANSR